MYHPISLAYNNSSTYFLLTENTKNDCLITLYKRDKFNILLLVVWFMIQVHTFH